MKVRFYIFDDEELIPKDMELTLLCQSEENKFRYMEAKTDYIGNIRIRCGNYVKYPARYVNKDGYVIIIKWEKSLI